MPQRLLIPPRWLVLHVTANPAGIVAAALVVLLVSIVLLGISLTRSWDAAREGRLQTCRSVNELSRKIYVFLGDVGVPDDERAKFLPSEDCGSLP